MLCFEQASAMNEAEWKTRKERINRRLRSLTPAWEIIRYHEKLNTLSLHRVAVEEYPTASGPADYAFFVHGRLLSIVEGKKVGVGAQNALEQAKRYSRTAYNGAGNWNGYRVPFLYATNGEKVFFVDVRHERSLSREISNFHTADALEEMSECSADFSWFATVPVSNPRLRYYQKLAIEKTEAAIHHGDRAMLLAMATGTGKTFTTVSQIYRMLESKQFKRILFLVDRRALAVQAVREFASFATPKGNRFNQEYDVYHQGFRREDYDDDRPFDPKILPEDYLTRPNARKTFVYVSTIQRMTLNLFGRAAVEDRGPERGYDEEADQLDIPMSWFSGNWKVRAERLMNVGVPPRRDCG
jgi:type I restriction enzyme R subunit